MKTAIITGISRGLGAAIAEILLALDYKVVGIGRTDNVELSSHANFKFFECDLSSTADFSALEKEFFDLAGKELEQLILINNAAIAGPAGVLGDLSSDDIASSIQLNLVSVVQLSNIFCRSFAGVETDKRIINISSGAAFTPIAGSGIYCIAKAAMEMLTQSIAVETAHHCVSAVSIQPGVIDTPMQDWLREQSAEQLPSVEMYKGFQSHEQLLPAQTVAENIIKSAVIAPARNGQSFSHDQYL